MAENNNDIYIYQRLCFDISKQFTKAYSTSFFSATRFFNRDIRYAIHSIYGFVRLADEIVDSFHGFPQQKLLQRFQEDYYIARDQGISTNPILQSFLHTVEKYGIPDEYIHSFLKSMHVDLKKKEYKTLIETKQYIYGSADVVGLMCLKVFSENNDSLFESLHIPAMRLGSAFQKVNFLRDLRKDVFILGRNYFPNLAIKNFDENIKNEIIKDIEEDFKIAYSGIIKLPSNSRLAVMVAYRYYLKLLKKIKKTPSHKIISKRVRVSNLKKFVLLSDITLKQIFTRNWINDKWCKYSTISR